MLLTILELSPTVFAAFLVAHFYYSDLSAACSAVPSRFSAGRLLYEYMTAAVLMYDSKAHCCIGTLGRKSCSGKDGASCQSLAALVL